jgi:hypothetical protein
MTSNLYHLLGEPWDIRLVTYMLNMSIYALYEGLDILWGEVIIIFWHFEVKFDPKPFFLSIGQLCKWQLLMDTKSYMVNRSSYFATSFRSISCIIANLNANHRTCNETIIIWMFTLVSLSKAKSTWLKITWFCLPPKIQCFP